MLRQIVRGANTYLTACQRWLSIQIMSEIVENNLSLHLRHSGGSRNPDVVPTKVGNQVFLDPGFRQGDGKAPCEKSFVTIL